MMSQSVRVVGSVPPREPVMGMSDVLTSAKEIAELIRAYNNMELYQKIVDLRDEIFKLSEENLTLKGRICELERQQEVVAKLTRDGNVYYQDLGNGERRGPFCLACWDGDRKLINLIVEINAYDQETIKCGRCMKAGESWRWRG